MPDRATTGRRQRRRATLQSVADAVGVSIQTVANSLRHPERVHEATRQRVIAEVRRQDYRPNTAGRSLRTNRVDLLAVCVSRPLSDGGIDVFLRAATRAAQQLGFHLLAFTEQMDSIGAVYDELLRTHAVDGFILTGTEVDDPRHVWLHDRDVPFVAIGRRWTTELGPFVDFDGVAGMRQVVDHLVATGRRRVAFVGPDAPLGPEAERLVGVEQALGDGPAELVGVHQFDQRALTNDPPVLEARFAAVLADHPDAVVAADDRYATLARQALASAGIGCGVDAEVALTGYGATDEGIRRSLTTVADPIVDATRIAVGLLAALVDDPDASVEPVMLEPALVTGLTG